MAIIKLVNVKKQFGDKEVTKGVNLEISQGKMTVIIGQSGEGKSVLLKQIIGLIKPTSGNIFVEGVDVTLLNQRQMNQQFKKFGYVFQFAALIDSLNTFENIGVTLLENGISKKDVMPIVKEKLRLVHLKEDTLYKYPAELSGGMRKRVGLARTLVTNPHIVLYDEPTTGLDPITARIIHELMYSMQKNFNLTSVIVSHDINIFKYADRVALLSQGKIVHVCDAENIWQSTNPYIYQFIRGLTEGPIQNELGKQKIKV